MSVLSIHGKKVIKLQDAKSDTYLYKQKSNLMELCVVSNMEPDFTMGQALMPCNQFDVKQEKNSVLCKINGIDFCLYKYVSLFASCNLKTFLPWIERTLTLFISS